MNDETLSTAPKPFVFVLMPFNEDFDDIYKLGIKEAAKEVGAYAERVDEQIFNEGILERIFNQISKADVIVADMTGRNPNVFYEVGYAHALGKIVLLLTQKADDIPFDLKHKQHIVYGNGGSKIQSLRSELTPRLNWAINESRRKFHEDNSKRILLSVSPTFQGCAKKFTDIPEDDLSKPIPIININKYCELRFQLYNNSLQEIPNIIYLVADLKAWLPTKTYDIITAHHSLQFLPKAYVLERFLPNLCEALNPRGILEIFTFTPEETLDVPTKYTLEEVTSALTGVDIIKQRTFSYDAMHRKIGAHTFHELQVIGRKKDLS